MDFEPHVLAVGSLYHPDRTVWTPGYQFNWDDAGHVLFMAVDKLRQEEVDVVWSGDPLKFWLVVDGDIIFLCWDFAGVIWGESPYTWHMARTERLPDLDFEPGVGAACQIHLVSAEDGIVRALRLISFTRDFSLKLHRAILHQADSPFDQKDYDAQLARLYAQYDSKSLRRLSAARCTAGVVEEVPLFELGRTVMTIGAEDALTRNNVDPTTLLRRHQFGDYGTVGKHDDVVLNQDDWDGHFTDDDLHDLKVNIIAVHEGHRIMSVYNLPDDTVVWCITEHDRSATTLLLPEEY